jgi:hypothetical protein
MESNQSHFNPSRGDLVQYRGYLYYYQPNGNFCYLYSHKEYVGRPTYATHAPGKKQIFKPTDDEIKTFLKNKILPMERKNYCVSKILVLPYSSTRITIPIYTPYYKEEINEEVEIKDDDPEDRF